MSTNLTQHESIVSQDTDSFTALEWREFCRHFNDIVNEDTKFEVEVKLHGILITLGSHNGKFQILIRRNGTWRASTSRIPVGLLAKAGQAIIDPEIKTDE